MDSFVVEIVTPIRVVNQEDVKYLRCPGIDGSFGVMKNHRNGVIALDVGEIKVETKDDVEWYATSGGFVEILDNKVELLLVATTVIPVVKVESVFLKLSLFIFFIKFFVKK